MDLCRYYEQIGSPRPLVASVQIWSQLIILGQSFLLSSAWCALFSKPFLYICNSYSAHTWSNTSSGEAAGASRATNPCRRRD